MNILLGDILHSALSLEIRAGGGVLVVWEIQSGGGSKMFAIRRGVCIFSGITHFENS